MIAQRKKESIRFLGNYLIAIILCFLFHGNSAAQDVGDSIPKSVPMQSMNVQRNQSPTGDHVLLEGIVKDMEGEPLIGVRVFVRETKSGATTDLEGNFTLSIPKGTLSTVEFSYVGMKTEVRTYDGKTNYIGQTIVLKDDGMLDEVVVTGLFDFKSSTFTGSTSTYSQEDLKMVANSNVLKVVQALDPSFIVDVNNINGSNPNYMQDITIRGNASFGGLQGEYSGLIGHFEW